MAKANKCKEQREVQYLMFKLIFHVQKSTLLIRSLCFVLLMTANLFFQFIIYRKLISFIDNWVDLHLDKNQQWISEAAKEKHVTEQ